MPGYRSRLHFAFSGANGLIRESWKMGLIGPAMDMAMMYPITVFETFLLSYFILQKEGTRYVEKPIF